MKAARPLVLLVSLFGMTAALFSQGTPVNNAPDIARALAGLPPQSDPALMPLMQEPAWVQHATSFESWWSHRPLEQIKKVSAWANEEMGATYTSTAPAIYFYSGPDFLYLSAFFPNASTYVMCAKEPVGKIPSFDGISKENLLPALTSLQKACQSLFNFSFFITEDMKSDLRSAELSGVAPILYVLMARTDKTIVKAEAVTLTSSGNIVRGNPDNPSGIRIDFTSGPGRPVQTLYYFSGDLSNSGLKANSGILKFCKRLGPSNGFLKSDSYLLHMDEFSVSRNFLLDNCRVIVQDDAGIPLRYFPSKDWSVRVYGNYVGPIEIFKQFYQKDLADYYKASNPKALPFGMGYRWQAHDSAVMVAFRKSGKP
ncbi:MAG: hypothetical protein ABI443_02555 [Chthoniobacterales bacterium]